MRLFGRQDSLLIIGLAAAAAVILARPVGRLIDVAYEVQQTSGLALIPAFVILTFVFFVHQQGKRQQMTAAAVAAAVTTQEARDRAQDMERRFHGTLIRLRSARASGSAWACRLRSIRPR